MEWLQSTVSQSERWFLPLLSDVWTYSAHVHSSLSVLSTLKFPDLHTLEIFPTDPLWKQLQGGFRARLDLFQPGKDEERKEGRREGGWRTDRKCSTGTRRCKTLHVFAPSGDVFWRPVGDMLGVCMCVQEARSQTHMACELHQNGWSRRGDDGKTVKFWARGEKKTERHVSI